MRNIYSFCQTKQILVQYCFFKKTEAKYKLHVYAHVQYLYIYILCTGKANRKSCGLHILQLFIFSSMKDDNVRPYTLVL